MPSPNGRPVLRAERRAAALRVGGARLAPGALAGRRVGLLSGIARPDAFRALVARLGATVASEARFADHHRFRAGEPERAAAAARAASADLLVTTEKDAARLPRAFLERGDIAVLEIALHFPDGEEALEAALQEAVGAGPL
jgi:tetraacyldisaccharide 4'-kinase